MLDESHKKIIRWNLDNKNFEEGSSPGLLSEDKLINRIILNIENSNIDKGNIDCNKRRYDYLYGKSSDGYYVLVEPYCYRLKSNMIDTVTEESYVFEWLLFSNTKINPSQKIKEVIFEFEDIKQWISKAPISYDVKYKSDKKTKDDLSCYIAKYDPKSCRNRLLYKGEDFNLYLKFVPGNDMNSWSAYDHDRAITYKALIVCELIKTYAYSDLDSKIIYSVHGLFSIMFGFSPHIRKLNLRVGDTYVECLDKITMDRHKKDMKIFPFQMPISQKFTHYKTLDMIFKKWFSIFQRENNIKNAIIKFLPLMNHEGSINVEEFFLALSLSFESLCHHFIDMSKYNSKIYKDKINELFEKVNLNDDMYSRMKNSCHNSNKKSQSEFIREILELKKIFTVVLVPNLELFIGYQKGSRNSTIHPNKVRKSFQGKDLYVHAGILYMLCYCYILNCLGIKEDKIIQMINKSGYKRNFIVDAQRLYRRIK